MKNSIYFLFCFFLISCGNKQEVDKEKELDKPLLSVLVTHQFKEKIKPSFNQKVADWEELTTLNSFLINFKKTTPNEALSNALELRDLVKSLKDSIKPKLFDIPSFDARVNLLNNEALRLADLTFIPSITAEEINFQIDKTLAAFSAVNSKINTILSKKRFEDEIDVKFDFIGIDSTKIDAISKNSIKRRRLEEMSDKQELIEQKFKRKKRLNPKKRINKINLKGNALKNKNLKKKFLKSENSKR